MQRLLMWWQDRQPQILRLAVVVLLVVGVNLVARLILRLAVPDAQDDVVPGLIVDVVTAAAMALWTFLRARRVLVSAVAGEAFFAGLAVVPLIVLCGPLVSGDGFGAALGVLLGRAAVAALVVAVGAALGVLVAVALGLDPLTRAYHAHAERTRKRPRRQ